MPSKVDKIYKQVKKQNPSYSESKAWATAWSIYCKYNNSSHCHRDKSKYLKKKKKAESIIEWIVKNTKEIIGLIKQK